MQKMQLLAACLRILLKFCMGEAHIGSDVPMRRVPVDPACKISFSR